MDDEPNPEVLAFASAVGLTLHNWSMVEIQMGRLFATISDITDERKIYALVDVVVSFEVRLAMLGTWMTFEDVDKIEREMWRKMQERLHKSYRKRHRFAHFSILDRNGTIKFFPFLSSYQVKIGSEKATSISEIHQFSDKTSELVRALDWFVDAARQRRGLQPIQTRPEPELVTRLRALSSPKPEEL